MCATVLTCQSLRSSVFWRSSCRCTGCGLTPSTATTTMTGCTLPSSHRTPGSTWPLSRSKRHSNTSVSLPGVQLTAMTWLYTVHISCAADILHSSIRHSKVDSKVRHDIKGECKGMTGDMLILAFLSRIKLANLNTSKLNHYSSFWSSVNRIFHGFVEPFHAKLTILNHYNLDRTITQLT